MIDRTSNGPINVTFPLTPVREFGPCIEEVLDAGAYVLGVGDDEGVKVLFECWDGRA